eukprot:996385-Ditylum_brightwellii.AAC.1
MFCQAEHVKVSQVSPVGGLYWARDGLHVGNYGVWGTCVGFNTRFRPWTICALLWKGEAVTRGYEEGSPHSLAT